MHRQWRTTPRLTATIVPILLFAQQCSGFGTDPLADRIETRIQPKLAKKDYVGLVVGVIDGKTGQQRVLSFGSVSVDKPARPTGDTLYEIGSATKVFTAITLAELVERGKAKLDEPVARLLPDGTTIPSRGPKPITLEHLATHTSSLPRLPAIVFTRSLMGKPPYEQVDEKQVFEFLKNCELKRDVGAEYEYSNLGAGLLGMALAHRAGVPFKQLVEQTILEPLHLEDTRFELDAKRLNRLAPPYLQGGTPGINWGFDALAGCGGLISSAHDMLKFLAANIAARDGANPLARAMTVSHTPRHIAFGEATKIALGWHVTKEKPDAYEVVWHNGGTGGYRSFIGFQPKTRHAVVVLSNSTTSVDNVAFDVFRFLNEARSDDPTEKSAKK